jgi:hypothetical protein
MSNRWQSIRKVNGEEHTIVATSLNNIGTVLSDLAIYKKVNGKEHTTVMSHMDWISMWRWGWSQIWRSWTDGILYVPRYMFRVLTQSFQNVVTDEMSS